MAGGNPEGFSPAPWEAGKPNPQGPVPPPQPPQPPQQGGYMGPAPAHFGGDDTGRGRTRQIPNQAPQGYAPPPEGYAAPPQAAPAYGAPQPAYGSPQPAYGSPQPAGYGPPPQGYPAPAGAQPYGYPAPAGAQPYSDMPYEAKKPASALGIVSLCLVGAGLLIGLMSVGIGSIPVFLVGGVLGYFGIRETAAWGKKSGRGIALAGTIGNAVLFVGNLLMWGAILLFVSSTANEFESHMNASMDGEVITRALAKYDQTKGDLQPGGPQIRLGLPTQTAVTGSQLTVPDLVSPTELKNPMERYSLTVANGQATVYYTDSSGNRLEVGAYPRFRGGMGSPPPQFDFRTD